MVKYIKLSLFCAQSGYTEDAVYSKIKRGDWPEGVVYFKVPDGDIIINIEGFEAWVEGHVAKDPEPHHDGRSRSAIKSESRQSTSPLVEE